MAKHRKPHKPGVFKGGVNTNPGSGVETLKRTTRGGVVRRPPKKPSRKK